MFENHYIYYQPFTKELNRIASKQKAMEEEEEKRQEVSVIKYADLKKTKSKFYYNNQYSNTKNSLQDLRAKILTEDILRQDNYTSKTINHFALSDKRELLMNAIKEDRRNFTICTKPNCLCRESLYMQTASKEKEIKNRMDFKNEIKYGIDFEYNSYDNTDARYYNSNMAYYQDNGKRRQRTIFTASQIKVLEEKFNESNYIVGEDRTMLARQLRLKEQQVKIWFQNRRTKLKQKPSLEV